MLERYLCNEKRAILARFFLGSCFGNGRCPQGRERRTHPDRQYLRPQSMAQVDLFGSAPVFLVTPQPRKSSRAKSIFGNSATVVLAKPDKQCSQLRFALACAHLRVAKWRIFKMSGHI